jgi:glycosyltransferase involved in cell wall biosynthesis
MKVSFCIMCQNEEQMIRQCLGFMMKVADKIDGEAEFVVVDGGSSDNTLNVLRSFKKEIGSNFHIYQNEWKGFAKQLNFMSSKAKGEWIFSLAADEVLSDDIFGEIDALISSQTSIAYSFPVIHLYQDADHMLDISDKCPSCRLRRNLINFSWKDIDGLENLYFDNKVVVQHSAHFTFPWQTYIPMVKIVHFKDLKNYEQRLRRLVKYSEIKASGYFGKSQEELIDELNNIPKYCHISRCYDNLRFYNMRNKMSETAKIRERVLSYCKGKGLDLGCGDDKIVLDAIGVDLRELMGVDIVGDATKLHMFKDNQFDYVYSSHFLEHLYNPVKALVEWNRVLKNNGYLILYLPHMDHYKEYNPEHLQELTQELVLEWLKLAGNFDTIINEMDVDENRYSFLLIVKKK